LFRAYGASINIIDGSIGPNFRAERSTVSIEGGEFSDAHFTFGSVVDLSDGKFTKLRIEQSSTLTLRDGEVGTLRASQGHIHMTAGHIAGEVHLSSDSRFTLEGGLVSGPLTISRGATDIHILGGTLAAPITV